MTLKHTKVRESLPGYCFPNKPPWNHLWSSLKIQPWMTPKDSAHVSLTWPQDSHFKCPGEPSGNQWLPPAHLMCSYRWSRGNDSTLHSVSLLSEHDWVNLSSFYAVIVHQYREVWCEPTISTEYFSVCDKHCRYSDREARISCSNWSLPWSWWGFYFFTHNLKCLLISLKAAA